MVHNNYIRMKKFKHNKIEQCKISQKDINTDKEMYCIILDCNGENIKTIGFYKTDILQDLLLEKGERVAEQLTQNVFNKAQDMLEASGIIKPTYEII